MKTKILFALAGVVAVAGCATAKDWQAIGGSRADGVVRLGYSYEMFEKPVLDDSAGQRLAEQRCKVWGYETAEAFGGATEQCSQFSTSGCMAWNVTKEYQCTGGNGTGGHASIWVGDAS